MCACVGGITRLGLVENSRKHCRKSENLQRENFLLPKAQGIITRLTW